MGIRNSTTDRIQCQGASNGTNQDEPRSDVKIEVQSLADLFPLTKQQLQKVLSQTCCLFYLI